MSTRAKKESTSSVLRIAYYSNAATVIYLVTDIGLSGLATQGMRPYYGAVFKVSQKFQQTRHHSFKIY
jgi:hypothetical protein